MDKFAIGHSELDNKTSALCLSCTKHINRRYDKDLPNRCFNIHTKSNTLNVYIIDVLRHLLTDDVEYVDNLIDLWISNDSYCCVEIKICKYTYYYGTKREFLGFVHRLKKYVSNMTLDKWVKKFHLLTKYRLTLLPAPSSSNSEEW
jgi:hypothetical protein